MITTKERAEFDFWAMSILCCRNETAKALMMQEGYQPLKSIVEKQEMRVNYKYTKALLRVYDNLKKGQAREALAELEEIKKETKARREEFNKPKEYTVKIQVPQGEDKEFIRTFLETFLKDQFDGNASIVAFDE